MRFSSGLAGLALIPLPACHGPTPDADAFAAGPAVPAAVLTGAGFAEVQAPDIQQITVGNSDSIFGVSIGGLSPIAVGDLDQNGYLDLAVGDLAGGIHILKNEADLVFSEMTVVDLSGLSALDDVDPSAFALSLNDRDGDRLPELWASGQGWLAVWPNQGGTFGPVELISTPDDAAAGLYTTFALGDIDGDYDVDIAVSPLGPLGVSAESFASPDRPPPGITRVLTDADGAWESHIIGAEGGQMAATAFRLSDFDDDSDLDLLIPGDRGYLLELWRNDGGTHGAFPEFTEVAGSVGLYSTMSGMAVADADLNGDGALDYGFTDVGPPRLYLSLNGEYYEGSAALGLVPTRASDADPLSGWALRFADFDNDGWLDAFQASGSPIVFDASDGGEDRAAMEFTEQTDVWWRGSAEGFLDVGAGTPLASAHRHFGAIPADLDNDGDLDLLVGGYDEPLHVLENLAETRSWLEIEVDGSEAFGAKVVVRAGDRTWVREVASLCAPGQEPQRLHFGLGDVASVDRVEIRWLGGSTTVVTNLPSNRIVSVGRER